MHASLLLLLATAGVAGSPWLRVSEANGLLNTTAGSASPNQLYAARAGAADTCVYGWLLCYSDATLLPSTTGELAGALATLATSATPPTTVRASSTVFHSTAPFVCPFEYGGGLGSPIPLHAPAPPPVSSATPTTVIVLQDELRGVVRVDPAALTLTVRAGSRLWQVWGWAADAGLSPQRGVPSAWGDLSVGGAVATSLHGAGGWSVPSGFNDIVTEYVWVDAAGEKREWRVRRGEREE